MRCPSCHRQKPRLSRCLAVIPASTTNIVATATDGSTNVVVEAIGSDTPTAVVGEDGEPAMDIARSTAIIGPMCIIASTLVPTVGPQRIAVVPMASTATRTGALVITDTAVMPPIRAMAASPI